MEILYAHSNRVGSGRPRVGPGQAKSNALALDLMRVRQDAKILAWLWPCPWSVYGLVDCNPGKTHAHGMGLLCPWWVCHISNMPHQMAYGLRKYNTTYIHLANGWIIVYTETNKTEKKTNIWAKTMPQCHNIYSEPSCHPILHLLIFLALANINHQPRWALMGTHKKHGRNQEPPQKIW